MAPDETTHVRRQAQMMALRAHVRGGPERLVYELAPVPVPGPGEALIEVHGAGITFAELGWDATWQYPDGQDRTPVIPSHEVSGVVTELGPGVKDLAVGAEVFGLIRFDRNGAAAEYVTAPATDLAARPRTVDHIATAAVPLAALTAWQALVDHAALKRGERVLVRGGGGGVGLFAVQLATHLGARVTATIRQQDAELLQNLGADQVILSDDTDAIQRVGADVLIDTFDGPFPPALYPALKEGGRLVTLSVPPRQDEADKFGVKATFFVVAPQRQELAELARLVDAGHLHPLISQRFPLSKGREAYASGALARPPGKTVLVVRSPASDAQTGRTGD